MRSIRTTALVLSVIVAAACSDNRAPTGPLSASDASLASNTISELGCVDKSLTLFPPTPDGKLSVDEEIKLLIAGSPTFGPGLFVEDNRQSALSMWENLKNDKLLSRPLQSHVDNEAKFTLNQLGIGGIQDPDGAGGFTAVTGSVRVLDLIFRCTGTTPSTLPEPPEGFNAEWVVVRQELATIIQQFTTSGGDVAVAFDGDALPDGTLLVIVGEQPADVQVNTPFPKVSNTVDVAVAGGVPTKRLSILVCPLPTTPFEVYSRGVIAHQRTPAAPGAPVGEGVEYLDPAERGNLACPEEVASNWRMEKGFFRQRLAQLASYAQKAWSYVGPKPLYAGHAMIGGSSDFRDGGFSPMVAVDPYLETEVVITDVSPNPATYGDAVNVTARLRVANVDANPAVYRGQWVSPDAVTGVVNKTNPGNTNLQMSARVDDGTPVVAITDDASNASWSFSCVNAGQHIATVDFATSIVEANAPVYGGSTASAPFTVDQRGLTVTADDKSRLYGDANPPLTGTLVGVQSQCDAPAKFTPVYATSATPASDVGDYAITAGVTFDEADGDVRAANYSLSTVPGTLTVEAAPLSISADDAQRQYGDANPPFTGDIEGTKNGDAITLTFATTAGVLSGVGSYPIVPTANGERLFNYVVTATNGSLTITQRPLTGSIDDKSKTQGATNPSLTGTVSGFVPGDGAIGTFTTTALTGSPVGTYPITLSVNSANYVWQGTDGVLTITAADAAAVLYGVESGTDGLSTYNAATGASTFIGRLSTDLTKYTTPVAMAADPASGVLYAWNNSDGNTNETLVTTGVLLSVNACTGAATQISTTASGVVAQGLAISPSGEMYLTGDALYRVDRSNGSVTLVGSHGAGIAIYAADFDPATGVLYGLAADGSTLYTINLSTGAATAVGPLSPSVGTVGGLVFTPTGGLLGSAIGGTFFDINKATGAVSNIRDASNAPQGMGYAPACSG